MLNGNEISEDFQLTNKELLSEEQCRELVQSMSDTLNKSIQEAEGFLGPSGFLRKLPECKDASSVEEWKNNNISPLEQNCKKRQQMLNTLSKRCERKIKQAGTCQVSGTGYGQYVDTYNQQCQELLSAKELLKNLTPGTPEYAAAQDDVNAKQAQVDEARKEENVDSALNATFFPEENNTDHVSFFPEEDIKAALSDW